MSSQRTVNNASVLGCSPEHSTYTICLCTEIWQRPLVNDMRDKTPPSMGVCYMFIVIPHMSETIFKNLWNLLDFFPQFCLSCKEDLTCTAFSKTFCPSQRVLFKQEIQPLINIAEKEKKLTKH